MANKDHLLDNGIIKAARNEFLEKGYAGASLRKIAERAGVTTGAIRTRYRTKDDLFQSLVYPLISDIDTMFQQLKYDYFGADPNDPIAHLQKTMKIESDAIVNLIFRHFDEAVLLLCRSNGSQLETFFDQMVEKKVVESLAFFRRFQVAGMDENILRFLISAQFNSYRQIVSNGYSEEIAKKYMATVMLYHSGGWTALLNLIKENQ